MPLHGDVPIVSSAILFAIGITIDIAIGFIFLLFFSLGGLPPPSVKKMRKIKPMAMSMVMPMAKRLALLMLSTTPKRRYRCPHVVVNLIWRRELNTEYNVD